MTDLPDFSALDYDAPAPTAPSGAGGAPWETPEGLAVAPSYGPESRGGLDHLDGLPGLAPFGRGPYPTMYATNPWTIRQYAGFSTAEDSNAFYRRNLAAGQMGLSVAFDLATHRGYDSDHPRVTGDVGMAGVAIDSILDMRTLFSGIPLDRMSVSMTMNGAVLPVLALYIVAAEEQGVPHAKLSGTIQNDILKEFMVRNTYIYPPAGSMRIISDIFAYTSRETPKFNSISISGYHMQEAGASADLELAYTLADGIEYIRAGAAAGLDVDAFAPRLSFFWAIGMNFFMEVAKMRAARLLWAKLVRDEFAAEGQPLPVAAHPLPDQRLVAGGAGRVQQRGAHGGGGHGRHQRRHAEPAHQQPGRGAGPAHRLLRPHRAQHPAVHPDGKRPAQDRRSLGRQLLRRAADARPGPARAGPHRGGGGAGRHGPRHRGRRAQAAHRGGRRPHPGAHRHGRAERGGREPLQPETAEDIPVMKVDNAHVRERQLGKLVQLRTERDQAGVQAALARLTAGARGDANLLELAVEAARAKATVGEISFALERVFDRHKAVVQGVRGVYGVEAGGSDRKVARARELVRAFQETDGRAPKIMVAKMGQDGHDRGQKVVSTAFADLGFEVEIGALFQTPAEAAQEAVEAGVHVVGASSLAAGHLTLVPELKAELAKLGRDDILVVVGGVIPPGDFQALRDAGAVAIFPPGTVVAEAAVELLERLNESLGYAQGARTDPQAA